MTTEYKTAGGNAAFHNFINDFADVQDPLERRRLALEKIDNADFGWYHIRAIMVAGVGFMTDAYDIFTISLAVSMMQYVYWENASMPSSTSTLLKVSTSVGAVIGQAGFGFLGDYVGRKKIYGVELIVIITSTILQCTAGESAAINFPALLTFYRIMMGIGIGGDYPLSSIITSEFSTTKWRGAIMGAVFANQGWGQLLGGIVAIILVAAYKDDLDVASAAHCGADCKKACDQMWRILIGLGAVPGMIALYFRLTIPESPRYTFDVTNELEKAAADIGKFTDGKYGNAEEGDIEYLKEHTNSNAPTYQPPKASWSDFWSHFGQWKYGKLLIGTAGSWFMLDIAFYGIGLNTAQILKFIGYASSKNPYESLYHAAAGNLILICAGAIPGYWVSVATIDIIGRRTIQLGGFIILTALFCGIGFGFHHLSDGGLLGLYVVAQFFENFGPNTTTFIIPGEVFPTRYRSTAHGLSAAAGKVGAIVAQTCIGTLENHGCAAKGLANGCWLNHVMEIFALFMLLGVFTTILLPETKRQTLEELSERLHDEIDVTKQRHEAAPSDDEDKIANSV